MSKNDKSMERRDFVRGLASLPVLGGFIATVLSKRWHDKSSQNKIFSDLEIDPDMFQTGAPTDGKMGDPIRLGIIGVGSRGKSILEALGFCLPGERYKDRELDLNIRLTGVCDVYDIHAQRGLDLSRKNRFSESEVLPQAKRYRHYQDLLRSKDVDGVIVATPDQWHAQMVMDAASEGKHIFCEKCLTRTIDEAYQVRDVIRKSPVVFQYGHQNRQQESYRIARKIIQKNVLGKITLVKTHTNRNTERGAWIRHLAETIDPKQVNWKAWLGSAPKTPFTPSRFYGWQKFFEYSGGLPPHMFSHEYDAINQVMDLGIPGSVMSLGGIYYWKDDRNTPDVMQALFEYPDREMVLTYDATLASSSTGEYESGAKVKEIYGSDAWMKLGMNINVVADRHSKRFKDKIENGLMSPTSPFLSYTPGSGIDAVTSASEKYYASQGLIYTYKGGKKVNVTYLHIREWLDGIRHQIKPSCDIDLAFEDTITCLMATKSYREGRTVKWDARRQRVI